MPGCPIAQISCVRLLCRNAVSSGFIPDDETIADWTSRAMAETLDAQSSCCSRGPSIFYQIVTSAFGEKHTWVRYYPLQMKLFSCNLYRDLQLIWSA